MESQGGEEDEEEEEKVLEDEGLSLKEGGVCGDLVLLVWVVGGRAVRGGRRCCGICCCCVGKVQFLDPGPGEVDVEEEE